MTYTMHITRNGRRVFRQGRRIVAARKIPLVTQRKLTAEYMARWNPYEIQRLCAMVPAMRKHVCGDKLFWEDWMQSTELNLAEWFIYALQELIYIHHQGNFKKGAAWTVGWIIAFVENAELIRKRKHGTDSRQFVETTSFAELAGVAGFIDRVCEAKKCAALKFMFSMFGQEIFAYLEWLLRQSRVTPADRDEVQDVTDVMHFLHIRNYFCGAVDIKQHGDQWTRIMHIMVSRPAFSVTKQCATRFRKYARAVRKGKQYKERELAKKVLAKLK